VQACCQNSNSSCCTGEVDPAEVTRNATCPCHSCWEQVATYVDKYVKGAGGVGLFFSFTEVTQSMQHHLHFSDRFVANVFFCGSMA